MRTNDHSVPTTPSVQVIERIFQLIDVLASREEAMSLKEISEKTGLHPSTTHRILNDLTVGRYVERPETGSYRLGMRLLELGNLVKGRLDVRDAALSSMRELHKLIQQPVNLSVRQGDEIVYVERAWRASFPTSTATLPAVSATPVGPPTASPLSLTLTPTPAATVVSPSSTTASSRTSPSCAKSWRVAATTLRARPIPRSSRI